MAAAIRREISATERLFVNEVLRVDEGKPLAAWDAYERAFGVQGSRASSRVSASRLLKTERVVKLLAQESSHRSLLARQQAGIARGALERGLWDIATKGERDSDRVSAMRELRQLVPDTAESDLSLLKREDIIERIRGLLASQLGLVGEVVILPSHEESPEEEATPVADDEGQVTIDGQVTTDTHPPLF